MSRTQTSNSKNQRRKRQTSCEFSDEVFWLRLDHTVADLRGISVGVGRMSSK